MNILNYIKDSLRRKIARRVTKEYPPIVDTFDLKDIGPVEFANWSNPLIGRMKLSSNMVSFFRQFIKEGDLIVDIGANTGDTTVPMALCAGITGLTLGFDPNPYVFKILQKNASLNKDKTNIKAVPYAISEREEEFYFASSEASFGNGGISSVKESIHGKFIYPEKIKGVNLKKFLEENYSGRLSKFTFIKIDTEGYDKEILKSIKDLILTYKPTIIAESFGKSSDADKMELYEVIDGMGYEIFYYGLANADLGDLDIESEVQRLGHKSDMTNYKNTVNIYAVPKR